MIEEMNKMKLNVKQFIREHILKFDLPFMEERRNFFTTKQKKKFIDYLNRTFPNLEISLLEVGSKGGLCYNYQILKYLNNFSLEGVEPQDNEASQLKGYHKIHNEAVFSKNGKAILHITKSSGCSSLLKPNFAELKEYGEEGDFEIVKDKEIEVRKLDSIIKRKFDFINLDIQGSEYDALLGGGESLNKLYWIIF